MTFTNESPISIKIALENNDVIVPANMKSEIVVPNVKRWTAETPNLYTLELYANGEKLLKVLASDKYPLMAKCSKLTVKQ